MELTEPARWVIGSRLPTEYCPRVVDFLVGRKGWKSKIQSTESATMWTFMWIWGVADGGSVWWAGYPGNSEC